MPSAQPRLDMNAVLKRAEAALRNMVWTPQKPTLLPPGILKAFDGVSMTARLNGATLGAAVKAASEGEMWIGMALVYRDSAGEERFEGAATCVNEGLIVRLTPGLAAMAMDLAEAIVCQSCDGTGADLYDGTARDCPVCFGRKTVTRQA